MDISLSNSAVSLRLTDIQKRCEVLMKDDELVLRLEDELELQLEDADDQRSRSPDDKFNPYKRAG